MALAVIGAGMGRTGTHTLKLALERLGLGPCHHMFEVMGNPDQTAIWRAAGRGDFSDWDRAFQGYRSAVDWPTAHFWRELSAHYPQAKVILTTRDPEAWHASVLRTIARGMDPATNDPDSFGVAVIGQTIFGGRIQDRRHAIAVHQAHNAAVQAALPPDRLLVYDVAQGWDPLCRVLGLPHPPEPFPHSNTTETFHARQQD